MGFSLLRNEMMSFYFQINVLASCHWLIEKIEPQINRDKEADSSKKYLRLVKAGVTQVKIEEISKYCTEEHKNNLQIGVYICSN